MRKNTVYAAALLGVATALTLGTATAQERKMSVGEALLRAVVAPGAGKTATVSGTFHYMNTMDDGLFFAIEPDAQFRQSHPQFRAHDSFLVANVKDMSRFMGLPEPESDPGTPYWCSAYSGSVTLKISKAERRMDDVYGEEGKEERIYVTVASVASKTITEKDCHGAEPAASRATSGTRFKNALEAARSLGIYDMSQARPTLSKGLVEFGANEQLYMPPNSPDTVVTYTEGNRGTPFLSVQRYTNGRWREVGPAVLPNFGTGPTTSSYYLDYYNVAEVKVRSKATKQGFAYRDGKFVPDGAGAKSVTVPAPQAGVRAGSGAMLVSGKYSYSTDEMSQELMGDVVCFFPDAKSVSALPKAAAAEAKKRGGDIWFCFTGGLDAKKAFALPTRSQGCGFEGTAVIEVADYFVYDKESDDGTSTASLTAVRSKSPARPVACDDY